MVDTSAAVQVSVDTSAAGAKAWIRGPGKGRLTLSEATYADMGSIRESSKPQYAEAQLLNRPEHMMTYVSTANREVSLVIRFAAAGTARGSQADTIRKQVIEPALWLDALQESFRDSDGVVYAPPAVYVHVGGVISMRAIVSTCSITWKAPWFYKDERNATDALPMFAEVNLAFRSSASSADLVVSGALRRRMGVL